MNPILFYEYGRNKLMLNTNLVAYFPFNNDVGEKTGLTPSGITTNTTYVAGLTGNAISFNNATARVDVGSSSLLSFTSGGGVDIPFSISIWVNVTTFSSVSNFLVNKRGDTTNLEWQLTLTPTGQVVFTKYSGGSNTVFKQARTAASTITTGSTFLLTFTDDGSKTFAGMKIYVNGVSKTLTDTSSGTYAGMTATTSLIRFGLNAWNLSDPTLRHIGTLEDAGIWRNTALNQAQINYLYNSGAGRTYPF